MEIPLKVLLYHVQYDVKSIHLEFLSKKLTISKIMSSNIVHDKLECYFALRRIRYSQEFTIPEINAENKLHKDMMELVVPEQHLDKENPSHEEEDNLSLKVSLMTNN